MLSHFVMDAASFVWFPHKLSDLHRKCNYSRHWKGCATTTLSGLFFFLQPFSQVIGEASCK